MTAAILEARGLTKRYGGRAVVDQLDLSYNATPPHLNPIYHLAECARGLLVLGDPGSHLLGLLGSSVLWLVPSTLLAVRLTRRRVLGDRGSATWKISFQINGLEADSVLASHPLQG